MPSKKYSEMETAAFDAKVLMRDKVAGKSGIVNLQFKGVKNQKIRLDVLSPIQTHIASLALNGEELSYVLVQTKQAYRGMASASAMVPVIRVPMNPKFLYNIFFDQPIVEKNWTCTKDKNDMLKECKTRDLKITWVSREGAARVLEIEHPKAFLQINIYKYQGDVSPTDSKFTLKIPDAFKLI
ncbi:MAG: hypothetical protein AABZ31_07110 [Bdellovibrionota bacterium]